MRPNGLLLDLHPEPEFPRLEVHAGDGVTSVGDLDTSANVAKVHAARAVLASAIDAGYFVREDATTFEFRYYFDTIDTWLAYMAERWKEAAIAPTLVTRIRSVLHPPTGRLVIRESVHAARLRATR